MQAWDQLRELNACLAPTAWTVFIRGANSLNWMHAGAHPLVLTESVGPSAWSECMSAANCLKGMNEWGQLLELNKWVRQTLWIEYMRGSNSLNWNHTWGQLRELNSYLGPIAWTECESEANCLNWMNEWGQLLEMNECLGPITWIECLRQTHWYASPFLSFIAFCFIFQAHRWFEWPVDAGGHITVALNLRAAHHWFYMISCGHLGTAAQASRKYNVHVLVGIDTHLVNTL